MPGKQCGRTLGFLGLLPEASLDRRALRVPRFLRVPGGSVFLFLLLVEVLLFFFLLDRIGVLLHVLCVLCVLCVLLTGVVIVGVLLGLFVVLFFIFLFDHVRHERRRRLPLGLPQRLHRMLM